MKEGEQKREENPRLDGMWEKIDDGNNPPPFPEPDYPERYHLTSENRE